MDKQKTRVGISAPTEGGSMGTYTGDRTLSEKTAKAHVPSLSANRGQQDPGSEPNRRLRRNIASACCPDFPETVGYTLKLRTKELGPAAGAACARKGGASAPLEMS
ncbi:hypothetical protein ACRRTK_021484 [Alexandromys fortis]